MKLGNEKFEPVPATNNHLRPRHLPQHHERRSGQEHPQPQEKELHVAYIETYEPKRAVLLHLFLKLVKKHTTEGNNDIIEKLAPYDFVDSEICEEAPNLSDKLKQHISSAFAINDDMVKPMIFQFRAETGYLIDPMFYIETVKDMLDSLDIESDLDNDLVGQLGIVLLARVALTTL